MQPYLNTPFVGGRFSAEKLEFGCVWVGGVMANFWHFGVNAAGIIKG